MARSLSADAVFLQCVMPRAIAHASIHFRDHRDREDLIQEVIIYCLRWTRLLLKRGKDPRRFPTALASFGVLAVKSGRRCCGKAKAKETLSPHAQARAGFTVERIPDFTTLNTNPYQEALIDNTVTPPDEQAAFRIDFPAWLATLTSRERRMIRAMLLCERTKALAKRFHVSPARISQLRRDFFLAWRSFHGGEA